MLITSYEKLTEWLSKKFIKLSNAEPKALAKYTLALIKKDINSGCLKTELLDKLKTSNFVDDLLVSLESQSYMDRDMDTSGNAVAVCSENDVDAAVNSDGDSRMNEGLEPIDGQNDGSPVRSNARKRRRHSSDDNDNRSWDHRRKSASPSRHNRNYGAGRGNRSDRQQPRDHNSNFRRNRRNERLPYENHQYQQKPQLVESFINTLQTLSSNNENPSNATGASETNTNLLTNILTTLATASNNQPFSTNYPSNNNNRRNQRNRRFNDRTSKYDSTMKTMCLSKIPQDHFNEKEIVDFFSKFGPIDYISMNYNNEPNSCLIEFQEHAGAKAAYSSPDPVFGNRFVKLFWVKTPKINSALIGRENSITAIDGSQCSSNILTTTINEKPTPTTNAEVLLKKTAALKKEQAVFVSQEYVEAKEKKQQEIKEKKDKVKEIENKIIAMCEEEQKNILLQLKNPDITVEQKENLTKMLKIVVEKKDSIIFKAKFKKIEPTDEGTKTLAIVPPNKVIKARKFQPVRRKIDRRSTQIIIYLKTTPIDHNQIIESYKKFGKIVSSTIFEGKHIIITYSNPRSVINSISYGIFMPEYIQDVKLYEPPTAATAGCDRHQTPPIDVDELNKDEIRLDEDMPSSSFPYSIMDNDTHSNESNQHQLSHDQMNNEASQHQSIYHSQSNDGATNDSTPAEQNMIDRFINFDDTV